MLGKEILIQEIFTIIASSFCGAQQRAAERTGAGRSEGGLDAEVEQAFYKGQLPPPYSLGLGPRTAGFAWFSLHVEDARRTHVLCCCTLITPDPP